MPPSFPMPNVYRSCRHPDRRLCTCADTSVLLDKWCARDREFLAVQMGLGRRTRSYAHSQICVEVRKPQNGSADGSLADRPHDNKAEIARLNRGIASLF